MKRARKGWRVWNALPERNRAWLQVWKVLPYEDVIDIDEKGDDWFEGPHIYVADFDLKRGPFRQYTHVKLATADQWSSRKRRLIRRLGSRNSHACRTPVLKVRRIAANRHAAGAASNRVLCSDATRTRRRPANDSRAGCNAQAFGDSRLRTRRI